MPDIKCPACGQWWKKLYHTGVCIDCDTTKIKPKIKPLEVKKIVPGPVVGENDAIDEPWWNK